MQTFHHFSYCNFAFTVYPNVENLLKSDALLLLKGRLNSDPQDTVVKIICEEVIELENVPRELTQALILRIDKSKLSEEKVTYLKNILNKHRGNLPVYFKVSANGKDEINMVSKKIKIAVNTALIDELEKILSIDNIKVKVKTN